MTLRQPYRQRSMNPHPRVWGESDTALSYDCVTPKRAGDVGSCAPTPNSSLLTPNWSFTFSAKERDPETGYSYFGSRYYSSDLSIWLSVDPMSDKYPSLSPYVYCANNPVKLVDPDGEDYEVVVEENTITIRATYYATSDCFNEVFKGAQAWNSQSGLYEYTTDEGKTYSVVFDLTVKKCNSTNDIPPEPRNSWNWVTTIDAHGAVRGDSNGPTIGLDINNCSVRTAIHEIGHTLGIGDDAYGVMESGGNTDFILDEHIMTSLKGAGIYSTNGSSNNSNCDCTQMKGANCVYENNKMNGSFRRKGL